MERIQILYDLTRARFDHDPFGYGSCGSYLLRRVLTNYGPSLASSGGLLDALIAFLVLVIFHCLLVMLLWCYFSIVFTDPGSVPPNWRPEFDEERGEADPLTASEFGASPADSGNPRIRFCRKCNQLKPPRCHLCSVCGRCVLKMDHHCVWVVNCVGSLNYKYFLLFLVFRMDKRYWFFPAYSEEDLRRIPALHGLEYPSKPDLDAQE